MGKSQQELRFTKDDLRISRKSRHEVPRSEEAEDFGVKKELPESEHGAYLREIEQWMSC